MEHSLYPYLYEKWEIKNILTKEKNTVDELISRRDIAKKLVNEHLDLAVETPKTATKGEKRTKRMD